MIHSQPCFHKQLLSLTPPFAYLLQDLTDSFVLIQLLPSQDLLELLIHLSQAARRWICHGATAGAETLDANKRKSKQGIQEWGNVLLDKGDEPWHCTAEDRQIPNLLPYNQTKPATRSQAEQLRCCLHVHSLRPKPGLLLPQQAAGLAFCTAKGVLMMETQTTWPAMYCLHLQAGQCLPTPLLGRSQAHNVGSVRLFLTSCK